MRTRRVREHEDSVAAAVLLRSNVLLPPTKAQRTAIPVVPMTLEDHGEEDLVCQPSNESTASGGSQNNWAKLAEALVDDARNTFKPKDAALLVVLLSHIHEKGGAAAPDAAAHAKGKGAVLLKEFGGDVQTFENSTMYSARVSLISCIISATWCRAGVDDPSRMMFKPGGVPTATAIMMVMRIGAIYYGRAMADDELNAAMTDLGAILKIENKVNTFRAKPQDAKKRGFQDIDRKLLEQGTRLAAADFAKNGARRCHVMLSEGDTCNKIFWPEAERCGALVHTFRGDAHSLIVQYLRQQAGPEAAADAVPEGTR